MGQEECWRRLLAVGRRLADQSASALWAVERQERWPTGRPRRPFHCLARHRAVEFGGEPEMGWIFVHEVHGQGMAGEACRAALDWADEAFLGRRRSRRSSRRQSRRRCGWRKSWASSARTKRIYQGRRSDHRLRRPAAGADLPAAAAAAATAAAGRTAAARAARRAGCGRGRADRAGQRRADRIDEAAGVVPRAGRAGIPAEALARRREPQPQPPAGRCSGRPSGSRRPARWHRANSARTAAGCPWAPAFGRADRAR